MRSTLVVAALSTLVLWHSAADESRGHRASRDRMGAAGRAREFPRIEAPAERAPLAARLELDAVMRGESGTTEDRARLRRAFNEEWRSVMARLECGCSVADPELLQYPDDWDAATK